MDIPRFYVDPETLHMTHNFWVHDPALLKRWQAFTPGQQIILFDGLEHERLYKLEEVSHDEAHVLLVTELEHTVPGHTIYLLYPFAGSKEDEAFLEQGTKRGVTHFLPILYEHTSAQPFEYEQAQQRLIVAVEASAWSTVPSIREPRYVATAVEQLVGKVPLQISDASSWQTIAFTRDVALVVPPSEGLTSAEQAVLDKVY
jgi:16S rRNA U1498 N3-methylase RsmE